MATFKTGSKEIKGWKYSGGLKTIRCLSYIALLSFIVALAHTKSLKINNIPKETRWENNDT